MTLLEHIESLGYLRDKAHRDAARLTIEMEAAQDVLDNKPLDVTNRHHAEQRAGGHDTGPKAQEQRP